MPYAINRASSTSKDRSHSTPTHCARRPFTLQKTFMNPLAVFLSDFCLSCKLILNVTCKKDEFTHRTKILQLFLFIIHSCVSDLCILCTASGWNRFTHWMFCLINHSIRVSSLLLCKVRINVTFMFFLELILSNDRSSSVNIYFYFCWIYHGQRTEFDMLTPPHWASYRYVLHAVDSKFLFIVLC